jgi:hypothetical protein
MRYIRITEVLAVPLAALPKLQKASTVPFALLPKPENPPAFLGAPRRIRTYDPRIRSEREGIVRR